MVVVIRSSGAGALIHEPSVRRLLVLTMLGFTGFAATLSALPWWAAENGASTAAAGLVTTVMMAVTVVTQPLVPAATTRFGVARTLAAGLALLGAPSVFYAVTPDLVALLLVSGVRGIGFGVLTVLGSVLTAQLAPPGRHGEVAGLYGLAVAAPNLVAVPGAVWLAQNAGFWPVVLLASMPLLAVPPALGFETSEPAGVAGPGGHRSAVLAALSPALVLTVVTLAGGGVLAFLPIEHPRGAVAGVALLLLGLAAALARWLAGVLGDRYGTRLLLPAFTALGAVGMGAIAAGLAGGSDALLLAGAAVFGSGYGAVQNLTLVIAFARAGPRGTTTASAVWNAGFDAGTGIGPLVVGSLAAVGLGVPGALGVVAAVVVLALPAAATTAARAPRGRSPG